MTVLGVPSSFRAVLMSVGKHFRNSSSVADNLLPIVFVKSSFRVNSLKLLERRVEWSRQSWTSTWNKLRCKKELQFCKERINCLSAANVSKVYRTQSRTLLGLSTPITLRFVMGVPEALALVSSPSMHLLPSMFSSSFDISCCFNCFATELSLHQRAVRVASVVSISKRCALISISKDLPTDNTGATLFRFCKADVWDSVVCSSSAKVWSTLATELEIGRIIFWFRRAFLCRDSLQVSPDASIWADGFEMLIRGSCSGSRWSWTLGYRGLTQDIKQIQCIDTPCETLQRSPSFDVVFSFYHQQFGLYSRRMCSNREAWWWRVGDSVSWYFFVAHACFYHSNRTVWHPWTCSAWLCCSWAILLCS